MTVSLSKNEFTPEEMKLWRNEFLFYLFCGFAPFYERECGVDDSQSWKVECEQQWEQWLEDLSCGEQPIGFTHLWQRPELN